jgi:hypothetical protein
VDAARGRGRGRVRVEGKGDDGHEDKLDVAPLPSGLVRQEAEDGIHLACGEAGAGSDAGKDLVDAAHAQALLGETADCRALEENRPVRAQRCDAVACLRQRQEVEIALVGAELGRRECRNV